MYICIYVYIEILGNIMKLYLHANMCIAIIFLSVCDVINFEINHSFLSKLFLT